MPRVSGAVGAISLHSSVCSNNLSLSVPGVEYLLGGSQWLSRGHNHSSHRCLSCGSYSTRRRRPCHVGQRLPGRTQDPCWCVFDTHTHTHTHTSALSVFDFIVTTAEHCPNYTRKQPCLQPLETRSTPYSPKPSNHPSIATAPRGAHATVIGVRDGSERAEARGVAK